jgi:hypothetical protein
MTQGGLPFKHEHKKMQNRPVLKLALKKELFPGILSQQAPLLTKK